MAISTPYRFVPLSPLVLYPDWAKEVSHDHPFEDGFCGHLTVEITNHTPLCVGGKQTPASDRAPGTVEFYRTPENRLAIPGSTLKGMLRNVLSIATFGHFRPVEDRRFGVRDISKAHNFYCKAINQQPVQAGWLTFEAGRWQIQPCSYVRAHQQKIIDRFNIQKQMWIKTNKAKDRYNLLNGLQTVYFTTEPLKHSHVPQVREFLNAQTELSGILVVTGQPGAGFDKNKAKKYEFVFYNMQERHLEVSNEVMADFQFIHAESDEWKYWKTQINQLRLGVPVFFHTNSAGEIHSLGLARMYRLAYKYRLHEAVGHTQKAHLATRDSDLVELIFGRIDENEPRGINNFRGRINVGMAMLQGNPPQITWQGPTVLSSPKPTFYPAYLRQKAGGDYQTLMEGRPELAGWKRYPVREEIYVPPPPEKSTNRVAIKLETLPPRQVFTTTIRFHNLRMVELGALLWALDFGERSELRHSLGMGKPFGFGQVQLRLLSEKSALRPNDPTQEISNIAHELLLCRHQFHEFMNGAWKQAMNKGNADWLKSEQLVELLAMCDPKQAEGQELRYWNEPKSFVQAKNQQERLDHYSGFNAQQVKPGTSLSPQSTPNLSREDFEKQLVAQQAARLAKETTEAQEREQEKQRREAAEAEAKAQREAEIKKAQKQQALQEMGEEERALEEIAELVQKLQSEWSNGGRDKLTTSLNKTNDLSLNDDEREKLQKLATIAKALWEAKEKPKALGKAIKRILGNL